MAQVSEYEKFCKKSVKVFKIASLKKKRGKLRKGSGEKKFHGG